MYEICLYVVLVMLIFIIGIKPGLILSYTTASLERIIQLYQFQFFKEELVSNTEIFLAICAVFILLITPFLKKKVILPFHV